MQTKQTKSEFTANGWMAAAKPVALKVGRNFAKPIPRFARKENKSFLQKLWKL